MTAVGSPKALLLTRGSHSRLPGNGLGILVDLIGRGSGVQLTVDDDYGELTPDRLGRYDLVISYAGYNSDLEPAEEHLRALLSAVEGGTPYIALHAATLLFRNQLYYRQPLGHLLSRPDSSELLNPVQVRYLEMMANAFLTWPSRPVPNSLLNETQLTYLEMTGSAFITHGPVESFWVRVGDRHHPITAGVPDFEIVDELYRLGTDRSVLHVLAEADGEPVLYVRRWGAGWVHYNALGHDARALANPNYQRLLQQAIRWMVRR
jgi:hypothetical protein